MEIWGPRILVLAIWWFVTMCDILMVATTGHGREHLEEQLDMWRDRTTQLLDADLRAECAKIMYYARYTNGGVEKR